MRKRLRYEYTLCLRREGECMNAQVANLIEQIESTESLRKAARQLDIPYSKAWKMVKDTESQLDIRLFTTHIGGKGGGWSQLTPECKRLLARFRTFEEQVGEAVEALFIRCFGDMIV